MSASAQLFSSGVDISLSCSNKTRGLSMAYLGNDIYPLDPVCVSRDCWSPRWEMPLRYPDAF